MTVFLAFLAALLHNLPRLGLLAGYCYLVAMGFPWWAVPLLVIFAITAAPTGPAAK